MPSNKEIKRDHEYYNDGFVLMDIAHGDVFDCYIEDEWSGNDFQKPPEIFPRKSSDVVTIAGLDYISRFLNQQYKHYKDEAGEFLKFLNGLTVVPIINAGENTSMCLDELEYDFRGGMQVSEIFVFSEKSGKFTPKP
jgi:hypothetical protein